MPLYITPGGNISLGVPVPGMVYLNNGYLEKSPQWTFLCREPSTKKRIWKFRGGLQPP